MPGAPSRYDKTTCAHAHFYCSACGSVTDVDVMENRISSESPVGSALMRHKQGDVVTVSCPDGSSYKLRIIAIA